MRTGFTRGAANATAPVDQTEDHEQQRRDAAVGGLAQQQRDQDDGAHLAAGARRRHQRAESSLAVAVVAQDRGQRAQRGGGQRHAHEQGALDHVERLQQPCHDQRQRHRHAPAGQRQPCRHAPQLVEVELEPGQEEQEGQPEVGEHLGQTGDMDPAQDRRAHHDPEQDLDDHHRQHDARHHVDDQRRGGAQRDDHDQRSQVDLHRATLQCVSHVPRGARRRLQEAAQPLQHRIDG